MNKPILNEETKRQIIENILQSTDFAKSSKYRDLLLYLAEASIKGETIKSTTLAYDFFGKEASFDPSIDSTVRSYISNLRKKLEHYYLTEGEKDKHKIYIPKGNYHLEFTENIPIQKTIIPKNNSYIYISIILALLGLLIYMTYSNWGSNNKKNTITLENTIWKPFLEGNKKTLFVIGDYYVFKMNLKNDRKTYVRDVQVNSHKDLDLFIKEFPELKEKIQQTSNSYLDESAPFCLSEILPSFVCQDIKFDIKLSSDVQLKDLQNNNIIYIGSHKNLNILNLFTRNLNFEYNIVPGGIKYFDKEKDSLFTYSIDDKYDSLARRDFPVVIKQAGPNNNSFMFFISIHDLGNISTVKYFTNNKTVGEFTKKVKDKNFIALFESRGYRREDFSIKLLHLNLLPKKIELPVK